MEGEEVERVEHARQRDEPRSGRVRVVEMEGGYNGLSFVAQRHLLFLRWLLLVPQRKIEGERS